MMLESIVLEAGVSDWAQVIAAIGTMAAATVAVVAAVQSYRSAKQNNETNEQMVRPRVVVYVDNSEQDISFVDLVILNEGGGLARDIRFTVSGDDPPMSFSDGSAKQLSDFDVISKGIKVLPAKASRSYFMLSTIGQVDEILALQSSLAVTYANSNGTKQYEDVFDLDFNSLPKMRFTKEETSNQKKLVGEVKKIRKVLEKTQ